MRLRGFRVVELDGRPAGRDGDARDGGTPRGAVGYPSPGLWDRMIRLERRAEPASPEAVFERTTRWVAVSGVFYRVVASPVPLAGFLTAAGPGVGARVGAVMTGVLVANLVLLSYVWTRPAPRLLDAPAFLVLDWAVAAGLNLWASSVIPEGTLNAAYHDVFWFYLLGTLALWTCVRGPRAAAVLIVVSVPLQVAMAGLNGVALDADGVLQLVTRVGWLVLSWVVVGIVVSLLHQGARLALVQGVRAGREAQQVQVLRSMHDTVLQTLEAIALRAGQESHPADQRLHEVRAAARGQALALRALLQQPRQAPPGLVAALREVSGNAAARGLRVDLLTDELAHELSPTVRLAVRDAVGEALTNVAKHAGVDGAVVRAVSTSRGVEVTVRDQGSGFDPEDVLLGHPGFGISQSVLGRMAEVGGRGEVRSVPGAGTRVRLWVPLSAVESARPREDGSP